MCDSLMLDAQVVFKYRSIWMRLDQGTVLPSVFALSESLNVIFQKFCR